jgi:hypothetical protein
MGETLPGEAGALLQAISTLMPYANGAAGDVVPPLRAALAALIAGDHAPTAASSSIRAKAMPLRRPGGAMRVGETRVDPGWPAQLARLRKAMDERGATLTALAHVAGIPPSTARDYLRAGRVPPADTEAAFMAWLNDAAPAVPEVTTPARPFPRSSGTPFRIGATTETVARA